MTEGPMNIIVRAPGSAGKSDGEPLKFIHCSDLHLDSSLETKLSGEDARRRRYEIVRAFERIVRRAEEQHVTGIIIAGDMFDADIVTARTRETVLDIIRQTPAIDYLYLSGNHDSAERVFPPQGLPENLLTFRSQWQTYRYGNVDITGVEPDPQSSSGCFDALSPDPDQVNIVTLHGQLSSQAGPDLIPLPALQHRGIDYLALGHLHSYRHGTLDERGIYCYCGCPEGRGFDECGEKGFVLLSVSGNHLEHTFVPHAQRMLFRVPTDITDCRTFPEILQRLRDTAAGIPPESLVRFILTGACAPDAQIDLPALEQELAPLFFYAEIRNETSVSIDPATFLGDVSLKGEFIRKVLASKLPERDKDAVIRAGLQALGGEEITL